MDLRGNLGACLEICWKELKSMLDQIQWISKHTISLQLKPERKLDKPKTKAAKMHV
jgi:hypothetical protein